MENNTTLVSSDIYDLIQKYSPFFKEARKRILVTLSVFIVATFFGFAFYENIIESLVSALSLTGINIVFTSPFQFINLAFSSGAVTGLVVTLPLIIFQILNFLKPALNSKEYRLIIGFVPFSLLLFVIGFAFGSVIMKWQIDIFLNRSIALGIGNILDISGLLSTVFVTSALMGIGFQFPIVLLLLTHLGILNRQQLSRKRSWIYLGSFIFALLLPPDSILADIFLSLPLIILFEITLILDRFLKKNQSLHSN